MEEVPGAHGSDDRDARSTARIGLWFAGQARSYEQAIGELREARRAVSGRSGRARPIWGSRTFSCSTSRRRWTTACKRGRALSEEPALAPELRALRDVRRRPEDRPRPKRATVLEQSKGQYKAYLPLAAVAFASSRLAAHADAYERHAEDRARPGPRWRPTAWPTLPCTKARWAEAEKLLEAGIAADEKSKDRLARAAKLTALAEVHLAPESRASGRARGAGRDAITHEDVVVASCGPRPPPRQPARRRAGHRDRARAGSFSLAVARMAPSSRGRLRAPPGASSRRGTRSIAPRSWPISGSAGSAGRDLRRRRRLPAPRKRSSTWPKSVAVRRRPSFSTTCRRSAISRRCRTGWVERRKASTRRARRRPRTTAAFCRFAPLTPATPWQQMRASGLQRSRRAVEFRFAQPGQRRPSLAAQGCVVNRYCTVVGKTFPATSVVVVDA